MVGHIVLFRWKPEATGEQVAAVMSGLPRLRERIPGIVSLACGADFSGRAHDYTHALTIRFSDRAAFDAYGLHPAHRAMIESQIGPLVADALDFDFEIAPED